MAQLVVRRLPAPLVRALKIRAARNQRSAEEEHRALLWAALGTSMPDLAAPVAAPESRPKKALESLASCYSIWGTHAPPRPSRASVATLLSWLSAEVSRRFAEAVRPLALTPTELAVIMHLGSDAKRQAQVAAELGASSTNFLGAVRSLLERGWMVRRSAAEDRRARVLELTAEGRARLEDIEACGLTLSETILERLDAGERTQLDRLLRKLAGL